MSETLRIGGRRIGTRQALDDLAAELRAAGHIVVRVGNGARPRLAGDALEEWPMRDEDMETALRGSDRRWP